MATNTPKLNLVKPELTDNVDIGVLNGNMDVLDNALAPTNINTPTAGQKLVFDGTNWVNLTGYVYVDTVYYTSSGTFVKADYPWLRAIRVKVQGAGGGGGGAATTGANIQRFGAGGGGGGYGEAWITNIAGLAANISVTRGAGGAGSSTGTGAAGGNSSFGTIVIGNGGGGGETDFSTDPPSSSASSVGGGWTSPQLGAHGEPGLNGVSLANSFFRQVGGAGGSSFMGAGGRANRSVTNGTNGFAGHLYGGGGSGAANPQNQGTNHTGGAGANGIVIVELYA